MVARLPFVVDVYVNHVRVPPTYTETSDTELEEDDSGQAYVRTYVVLANLTCFQRFVPSPSLPPAASLKRYSTPSLLLLV